MRRASVALLALLVSGCMAAVVHPPVVAPRDPIRDGAGSGVERIAVVSVAAVGTSGVGLDVRADESRRVAERLHVAFGEWLSGLDLQVIRSSGVPRGYFDSETRFQEIGVNAYGGEGTRGDYWGRTRLPSFYCVDDSMLREPAARRAWAEVLGRLHTLRKAKGRPAPISGAARLREAAGADALLLVVTRVIRVSAWRQIGQALGSGIVTLGMIPAYEPSSAVIHVYLLDLERGEFGWADAVRVNRADSLAIDTARRELIGRWR